MPSEEYEQKVREQCSLPDGWGVTELAGWSFEVSDYDGETMAECIIEVIPGDQQTELSIAHVDMPGRKTATALNRGEKSPEILDVPSPVGVLQFHEPESEAAIEAIDALSDADVLTELATKRDFVASDDPSGVLEAVEEVTEIDVETVDGTLESL